MAKENAATGQVAATGMAMSANGHNHAHLDHITSVNGWKPGQWAIWRNADHDLPVVLTSIMGEQDGQPWWGTIGSKSGIPEAELLPLPIDLLAKMLPTLPDTLLTELLPYIPAELLPHPDDLTADLGEYGALLAQAKVEPADVLSATKVQAVIDLVATYQGIARQAGLEALTRLIGHLPAAERQRLNLYSGGLFVQGKQVEAFLAQCPPPPGEPLFKPLSLSGMLALPPKEWLIRDVLGAGDLVMLYGPPGGGKTFAVIDLIFAACLGQQFAKRFDVARALSVAYCAGEGVGGLPQRFAAAAEYYGVSELPGFTFFAAAPQLFTALDSDPTAETIGRFVAEWKARQAAGTAGRLDVLVIDTMHAATTGADENSAQDMGKVLAAIKGASRELGCAVLLVHHSNKQGSAERGSSALRGAMDAVISIFPASSKFTMTAEKIKDAQLWKGQTFDLVAMADSVRVWWDEVIESTGTPGRQAEALHAEMAKRVGVRFAAKQLAEAAGMSQSAAINVLTRLVDKGTVKRSLLDETKPPSSRNYWVYFVEDNGI